MCRQIHVSPLSNSSFLSHYRTFSFLLCSLIFFALLLPKPLIITSSLSFFSFTFFFLSFSPLRILPFFYSLFFRFQSGSGGGFFFFFHIGFLSLVSIFFFLSISFLFTLYFWVWFLLLLLLLLLFFLFSFLFTGFFGLVSLFFPWVLGLSGWGWRRW